MPCLTVVIPGFDVEARIAGAPAEYPNRWLSYARMPASRHRLFFGLGS
jgi:hypothetical protein